MIDVNLTLLHGLHDRQVFDVLNCIQHRLEPVIIFIEVYGSSVSLYNYGLQQGYQIIILTANSGMRRVPVDVLQKSALAIRLETNDHDLVITAVRYINTVCMVRAIIPGFEYFVSVACMAAHAINLPATTLRDSLCIRNKLSMRKRLQQYGVEIPRFFPVSSLGELPSALQSIGLPAVLKPIDAAGSVHVRRVTTLHEAQQAAEIIIHNNDVLWGHRLSNILLIEEYIDGDEYSVEGVISEGSVTIFAVTKKMLSNQVEFIEVGHIVHPDLATELEELIQQYLNTVVHALKPNACAFHAELRINRSGSPVLMEIAARLPGDKIGDLIMMTNLDDYYKSVYQAYFGERGVATKRRSGTAGIRFFYRPHVSRYSIFHIGDVYDHYQPKELVLYYPPDTDIPAFPKPLRRLGHVILLGMSSDRLNAALDEIDSIVDFK